MTVVQARARRAEIAAEMRGLHDSANGGALAEAAQTRWVALEAEATTIAAAESRAAALDALDLRAAGQPVNGTGDNRLDTLLEGVGLLDAVRAQLGGTDHAAGRAREASQALEARSGRKAQGILWHMGAERRTVSTALPVAGPGANLVGTDHRADLFVDRLRAATKVRALGATVLAGLQGNVVIPKRLASAQTGWFMDDSAIPTGDQKFGSITLQPKHAGVITEWSRNMVLQASPDVEMLARDDMARQLAETLDLAAIKGSGTGAEPRGILNTPGVGVLTPDTNGSMLAYAMITELVSLVDAANASGATEGFLANTRTRKAASQLVTSYGEPLGLDVVFQGRRVEYSNLIPSDGTRGTSSNLSSLLYGNWSDLLIGIFAELDILVNPYESGAYSRGGVSIRAIMSCDVNVRHAESFAVATGIIT